MGAVSISARGWSLRDGAGVARICDGPASTATASSWSLSHVDSEGGDAVASFKDMVYPDFLLHYIHNALL
jgi:hypothetical protein